MYSIHRGRIYYFVDGALFCYGIAKNTWEWPRQRGDITAARRNHLSIISEDTVYLFGGDDDYNDLHILDMNGLKWERVHGNLLSGEGYPWFWARGGRSFTRLSQSTAILFGSATAYNFDGHGLFDFQSSDCWLLDLHRAKTLKNSSRIWTRVKNHFFREEHAAVLEPASEKLWVIGGVDKYRNIVSDVLKVSRSTNSPMTLKTIARDRAALCLGTDDARLQPNRYPTLLRREIEQQRSRIATVAYMDNANICSAEGGCEVCLRLNILEEVD